MEAGPAETCGQRRSVTARGKAEGTSSSVVVFDWTLRASSTLAAFALDAGGAGDLGEPAAGLGEAAEGREEGPGAVELPLGMT